MIAEQSAALHPETVVVNHLKNEGENTRKPR